MISHISLAKRVMLLLVVSLVVSCGDDVSSSGGSISGDSNTGSSGSDSTDNPSMSTNARQGQVLYDSLAQGCLSCHGADGQATTFKAIDLNAERYEHSSVPGVSYSLEEYIELWMPVSDPSTCIDSCATNTAAFIRTLSETPNTPSPQLVADASASQNLQGYAPLTVSFNGSQSSGVINSYEWAFGTGEAQRGSELSHTYTSSGTYQAQLTVSDSNGNTASDSITVVVLENAAPTARITASAVTGIAPLTVQLDASDSSDDQGVTSYQWTIQDATINGAVNDYTFTEPGVYEVNLTVQDDSGLESSAVVTITVASPGTNIAPVADASRSSNLSGPAPLTVNFDASGSQDERNEITGYYWWFAAESEEIEGVSTTRTFDTEGLYTVALTVMDSDGATSTINVTVNVNNANQAPQASITALSSTTGLAPYSLNLSSSASSDDEGITQRAWDINGDNTTDSTATNPTFNFSQVGNYNVSLTVTDDQGASDSDTVSVEVLDPAIFAGELYMASCSSCHGADGSGGTTSRPLTQTWEDVNLEEVVTLMLSPAYSNANCRGVAQSACANAVASYIVDQFPPSSSEPPVVTGDHLISVPVQALTQNEFFNTIESVFSVSFTETQKANFNVPLASSGNKYSTESELRVLSGISADVSVLDDLYPALTSVYESVAANLSNSDIQNAYGAAAGCPFSDITSDEDCRTAYSAAILSKAFRRTVSGNDYALNNVSDAYDIFVLEDPSDAFVKSIVSYTLFSPGFIFHGYGGDEQVDEDYQLTNEELAHKIAYLIWGSPADSTLLSRDWNSLLAGEDDTALNNELTRLFTDDKSKYFVNTFLDQWLDLETDVEQLLSATSDSARASEFVAAIKGESEHFIRHLITQNESINSIINADYTFMNNTLADYYGVSNAGLSSNFTRVDFEGNEELDNRQGLLTQANFLTTDSKGDRPGTIHRGVTILKEVMCYDIGIPSGMAPETNSNIIPSAVTESFMFRDATENNEPCSSCHLTINPVSFPFEAFDRFGRHPLALSQEGSLFEYAVYELIGIDDIAAADGPTIKDGPHLLNARGGNIDITNNYGSVISGGFSDHKGLISLIGQTTAFGECLNDNLYDFLIGTNAERGLNASSVENASQHVSQTASKQAALEGADGVRTLIANLLKRPEFRVVRRN